MILLGCPGSGKSTIYSTLASALNTLNGKATQPFMKTRKQTVAGRKMSSALKRAKAPVEEIKDVLWPRVDLSVVFPKSLTCEEVSYEIYGVVKIPSDVRRTYSQYRYFGVQGSNSNECYGQIKVYFSHFQCLADDLSSAFVFKQMLSE